MASVLEPLAAPMDPEVHPKVSTEPPDATKQLVPAFLALAFHLSASSGKRVSTHLAMSVGFRPM